MNLQALQKLSVSVQRTLQPHIAGLEPGSEIMPWPMSSSAIVVPEHELLTTALAHRQGEVDLAN